MKVRSFALLALVAVPVVVSASRQSAHHGAAPIVFASGVTSIGGTSFLGARTRTAGCTVGPLPDRRCSPGAYERSRPRRILCDPAFHTGDVRLVPDSVKHQVEVEYGLAPKPYGRTLEIDHIISLELGGSNDPENLYPELAPGYHAKDKLENRLHRLVCAGTITLRAAQRQIATNWTALYAQVFGAAP